MKIHAIPTGNFMLDGGAMFGVVPKTLWEKRYPANASNLCNWTMRCMLVETDDGRLIMIDNGIGDKQDDRFFKHYYLNGDDSLLGSIRRLGYEPEDITDMLLTHLHFDHAGGGVQWKKDRSGFELTFPNANYWVSRGQWDWAMDPNPRERASYLQENLLPMQDSGHLRFIEAPGSFMPGIDLRFVHGHTEAQVIPIIDYQGRKVVFMADLMPAHVHMPLAWVIGYDVRPLESMKEKQAFLQEAADGDYILFFEHDLYSEACTVQHTEKGVRERDIFKLDEYFSV